jgi:hypothetical protein
MSKKITGEDKIKENFSPEENRNSSQPPVRREK